MDAPTRRKLRLELLEVFTTPARLKVLAGDAGVPAHKVPVAGSMDERMGELLQICEEAADGSLTRLLELALEEYPHRAWPVARAVLVSLTGAAPRQDAGARQDPEPGAGAPQAANDRRVLQERLERLLPAQFERVVFTLSIPFAYLSGANSPQTVRAIEVIRYCEEHLPDGLSQLAGAIQAVSPRF